MTDISIITESSWEYAERLLDESNIPADEKYLFEIEISDCKNASELREVINRIKDTIGQRSYE